MRSKYMHFLETLQGTEIALPGMVISVPVGLFVHRGIVAGWTIDGTLLVISSSLRRGCATEETLEDFSQGNLVTIEGFRGSLTPEVVVSRARSMIGRAWSILDNCEHFVARACGEKPSSQQLQKWAWGTLIGVAIMAAAKARRG